jgi:hypothetical protein
VSQLAGNAGSGPPRSRKAGSGPFNPDLSFYHVHPALNASDEKRPLGLGAALQGHQKMGKSPADKLDVKTLSASWNAMYSTWVMLLNRAIEFAYAKD